MKKNMKIGIISIILSLNFFIYESQDIKSYALQQDTKLDILISNKIKQELLQEEIDNFNEILENKIEYMSKIENENFVDENKINNNLAIINLRFVKNNKQLEIDLVSLEIDSIKNNKDELEKQLEECMIDSVRLEKSIEEDTQNYLKENNLEFISGNWPLEEYTYISSGFGYRIHPITKKNNFHRGIDIPASENTDILASDSGIVIFSGFQNGYGNVVKIKHFDGKKTVYAHNISNIVKEGDIVKQGQIIAKVGSTGNSTGNHVHFETIFNDKLLNPINVVNK